MKKGRIHNESIKNSNPLRFYVFKYKWHYLLGIIAILFVDVVQLQIPIISRDIADGLKSGNYGMDNVVERVMFLLIIGIAIAIGRFIWRYYIFGTSRKIEYDLRNDFFGHLEKLSLRYYNEHQTGDLMAHATNDINAIRMMTGPGVLMALDSILLTVLVVVQMVTVISLELTLVAIIPLPLIAIGSLLLGRLVRIRFREKQEAFSKLTEHVQENLSGIRVIKAFVQETKELKIFDEINQKNFEKNMRLVKLFAWMLPLAGLITGLSIALILGYGGYLTILGVITLGDFVAYINYLYMLIWPMMAFGWCINLLSQGSASLKRLQIVLSERPDIVDSKETVALERVKGNIRMNGLTFTYPNAKVPALNNINLSIEQGQTLGIVGRTGSGKTTLANLLLRLFDPPEGTMLLDGVDIRKLPLQKLRTSIGYVPQDNFLFSDTIQNNIAFGLPEATYDKVVEAAKVANIHENIIEFSKQYETVVGEKGVTLSGGQKQRVSIARAMIMEAPIMILDDAVSAVDTHTEEVILEHLKEKRKDKTTIIIAHRISTLQQADKIIVLDEGSIVEEGNHEALMKLEGIYYDMVRRQQLERALADKE